MKKISYATGIFAMVVGLSICYYLLVPATKIKASPAKTIKIDATNYYTYEIPQPSSQLQEKRYSEQSDYKDFVQGEDFVYSWQKKNFYTQTSPVDAAMKSRSKQNMVVVDDGIITLDYFATSVEDPDSLEGVQVNKMNAQGEKIKTVYLGAEPSSIDSVSSETNQNNYTPMMQDIIKNEQARTITILGLQNGVPRVDVFDYNLEKQASKELVADTHELVTVKEVDQEGLDFQTAALIDEENVLMKPRLKYISATEAVSLPLMALSENFTSYEELSTCLTVDQLQRLSPTLTGYYDVTVDEVYFGENNQLLAGICLQDTQNQEETKYYVCFDEEGKYVTKLEVASTMPLYLESSQAEDQVYISSYDSSSDCTTLYEFLFEDNELKTLKNYEHIQALHIYPEEDLLITYGKTTGLNTEDTIDPKESGTFIATLDYFYNFESMTMIPSRVAEISLQNIYKLPNEEEYFINGVLTKEHEEYQLVDAVEPSDFDWSEEEQVDTGEKRTVFYGRLTKVEDYAPVICAGKAVVINREEVDLSAEKVDDEGYTVKDRLLLFGDAQGDSSSEYAVTAYDTYDIEQDLYPITQEELIKKINRNPKNNDLDIDWAALGFNEKKIGPQRTTYFVADTQNQLSSTSKVVNVVDNQTVYDETTGNMALRVEDFVISQKQVASLTEEMLTESEMTKNYGQVLAWDLIDETQNYNETVRVNTEELEAINHATQFGQFKLTYYLTRNGCTIERETLVYVLDENSEQVGNILFHVENGLLPWDVSSTATTEELTEFVLQNTHVRAYDFTTGADITEKATPAVEDVIFLKTLEPEDATSTPQVENPMQVIHYSIDGKPLHGTGSIEVYYRFEDLQLTFIDADFAPIHAFGRESNLLIKDQIVGKTVEGILEMSEVNSVLSRISQTEEGQTKIYLADKTTEVANQSLTIICQHGQGNQLYLQVQDIDS